MIRNMLALALLFGATIAFGSDESMWMTDFEAAKKAAAEKKVPILVDFTGSDWCGWCIKLKDEVFSKDAFISYAKENAVLLELDFPMKKEISEKLQKQNEALLEKYGVRGFPTILLLDAEGKELARTGYRRGGPEAYVKHLKALLAEEDAE